MQWGQGRVVFFGISCIRCRAIPYRILRWMLSKWQDYPSGEVAACWCLHSHAGTRKVGTPYITNLLVNDNYLKVNTRTQYTLQAVIEYRIFVKFLSEVRARLLCVNESHLHTTPNETGKEKVSSVCRPPHRGL